MRMSFHGALTSTFTALYTENADQTFEVHHCSLCNTSNGNVKVRLCVCGPGETPTSTHALLWDLAVTQNQTLEALDMLVVPSRAVVWGWAATDNVVAYTFCGDHG